MTTNWAVTFGTTHHNRVAGWVVFGLAMAAVAVYITYQTVAYVRIRRRYRAEHGIAASNKVKRRRAVPPFMAGKRGARYVVVLIVIGAFGVVVGPFQIAKSPSVAEGWFTTVGGIVLLVSGVYWARLRRNDVQSMKHARHGR